jgi:hypothetical protein
VAKRDLSITRKYPFSVILMIMVKKMEQEAMKKKVKLRGLSYK